MFLEFIATLAAAFALAGIAMTLNWLSGKRLPGWIVPVAAGMGMLLYQIWSEYSWYTRAAGTLPDGVEVVSTNTAQVFYRPWSYVIPQINRLRAVDTRVERTNPNFPDQVITAVVFMGRWEPTRTMPMVIDCARQVRADLAGTVRFADDGSLEGATWLSMPPGDAVLRNVCDRRRE